MLRSRTVEVRNLQVLRMPPTLVVRATSRYGPQFDATRELVVNRSGSTVRILRNREELTVTVEEARAFREMLDRVLEWTDTDEDDESDEEAFLQASLQDDRPPDGRDRQLVRRWVDEAHDLADVAAQEGEIEIARRWRHTAIVLSIWNDHDTRRDEEEEGA
jgi:hypothetical protein